MDRLSFQRNGSLNYYDPFFWGWNKFCGDLAKRLDFVTVEELKLKVPPKSVVEKHVLQRDAPAGAPKIFDGAHDLVKHHSHRAFLRCAGERELHDAGLLPCHKI